MNKPTKNPINYTSTWFAVLRKDLNKRKDGRLHMSDRTFRICLKKSK